MKKLTFTFLPLVALGIVLLAAASPKESSQSGRQHILDLNNLQEGAWLDTTQLPNGPVYVEFKDDKGNVVETAQLDVQNSVLTQVASTGDIYAIRNQYDNEFLTELYQNQITGEIEYREVDLVRNQVLVLRAATVREIAEYNSNKRSIIEEKGRNEALAALKSNPEQDTPYDQFVTRHTGLSQNCVTQLDQMLSNQTAWDDLSPAARNTGIRNLASCVRHAEFVNTKILPNLYHLLLAEGILDPVE